MADLGSQQQSNKHFPKDGLVIISMMKDLGITNYEPRVVNQLLEFTIRYVSSVLDDARAFATHSNRKSIDNDDVKLAVMMQLDRVFTTPPPRDLLLEVARAKNNIPLPMVKPHCGIRLPPDRYCFSSANYRLKTNLPSKKNDGKMQGKFGMGGGGSGGLGSTSIKVSKPIATSSAGSSPATVSIKRPPNIPAVVRTSQSSVGQPSKPVIKLSTNSMMVSNSGASVVVSSSASSGSGSGFQPMAKARVVTGQQQVVAQQVEVKLEPQDSLLGKRKREDGD